ncbi:MAG TPA: ABC transporter substrate-binding protein [Rhodopila sp.]|uniref:ABC transporter substrate-binding protein n=1 Tax=Rhodopila sp. TaxID=2480087 RepID=UPI002B8874F7|nr:ABC transporter substrate-binding protein [Rhodopila sp.]HVY16368.1 ABC transporter substrate-binding protein [Rhodopila sp.]
MAMAVVTGLLGWGQGALAQDIKLGMIAGLSGFGASYGASMQQGVEMAIKEINDAGGINGRKLVEDVADDASDPAQSVLAMQRLVNDHVDIVVGGWGSSMVLANMEVAERAGMPYIVVGASNPRITTKRNKWTFRILTNDNGHAVQLADLAVQTLHMKRIAVINDSNDYGVGARDIFIARLKELDESPVDVESYGSNDKDFTAQLSHIAAANPDGIALMGTLPAVPAILNQARDQGIDARFFGPAGLSNEAMITLAPEASQHTIATAYFHEDLDPQAKAWADKYTAMFKNAAQAPRPSQAVSAYRGVYMAADCLKKVGTDKDKVRLCLKDWHGHFFGLPPADLHFDDTNQLVVPVVIEEVQGKGFAVFKPAH